jgi:hypothetical protein
MLYRVDGYPVVKLWLALVCVCLGSWVGLVVANKERVSKGLKSK